MRRALVVWILLCTAACRPTIEVVLPDDVAYYALVHHDADDERVAAGEVDAISDLSRADQIIHVRSGEPYVVIGWSAQALDGIDTGGRLRVADGCVRLPTPDFTAAVEGRGAALDFELTTDDATDVCPSPLTCVQGECVEIAQVATGRSNTCARLASGRVTCTGRNDKGSVGIGTNDIEVLRPAYVEGVNDAIDIDVGHDHVCAVHRAGTVSCWGAGTFGQLGDNTYTSSSRPVVVFDLDDAVEVALGAVSSCARSRDGRVRCWGSNVSGQLGTSAVMRSGFAIESDQGFDAVSITSGWDHVCMTRSDGSIRCWGQNGGGQLGSNDPSASSHELPTPRGAEEVVAGDGHTCARTTDGTVYCWGLGADGQLGNGQLAHTPTPMPVSLPWPAAGVDAGGRNACAWNATGDTACWGHAHEGLIDADSPRQAAPKLQSWPVVRGLALDISTACRLDDATTTSCWGNNHFGNIGVANARRVGQPVQVQPVLRWTGIAAGHLHTCGWDAEGRLACWGLGLNGSLARDTYVAGAPMTTEPLAPVEGVAANLFVNCARHNDRVSCWGLHHFGASVTGPSIDPIEVSIGATLDIDMSNTHACAVLADGSVSCWGEGGDGLGAPFVTASVLPRAVGDLGARARDIAVGSYFTCAALEDDRTVCFGRNDAGQLGNNAPTGPQITTVRSVTAARRLDTFEATTCAVTANEQVWCWGSARSGIRAVDPANAVRDANLIPLESGAASVSVGDAHACATTTDGALYCWGQNLWGQIGAAGSDRDLIVLTPHRVPLPSAVVGVSAGAHHTCAWASDGAAWCFGDDAFGQLGGSSSARIASPTPVDFTP